MYMYICICIYIHMCIYIYTYIHACMYVYISKDNTAPKITSTIFQTFQTERTVGMGMDQTELESKNSYFPYGWCIKETGKFMVQGFFLLYLQIFPCLRDFPLFP